MTYMSNYPQAPDGNDPWAWAWRKIVREHDGQKYAEWYGASQYYSAVVSNFARPGWQATMAGTASAASGYLDQCSPYRATVAAAKAWAERYGMTRAQLKSQREQRARAREISAVAAFGIEAERTDLASYFRARGH